MFKRIAYIVFVALAAACSPDVHQTGGHAELCIAIDAIVPDYGPPGSKVEIRGNNFPTDPSMIKVLFDDIEVPVLYSSVTRLEVLVPDHKPGDVPVSVTSAGHTLQRYFYILLADASEDNTAYPRTDAGKALISAPETKIPEVLWDTTYTVANGVDYYKMKVITDDEQRQDIYLIRAVPSKGIDIKIALPNTTTSSVWGRQTLTKMASNMNTTSNPVYAMINGDFWNTADPIRPRGPVHCSGKIWSSSWDYDPKKAQQGLSFVGVTDDGLMMIAPRSKYDEVKEGLKECCGAGFILLENGKFPGSDYTARDPRTAIGHTSDNVVWMLTVDGRHGTKGMTYAELASVFRGVGCVSAANLDGGGSAQMLLRNPVTDKMQICNWPSDPTDGKGGQERPVVNGWAIVKK